MFYIIGDLQGYEWCVNVMGVRRKLWVLSQWAKANVGLVSEMTEIIELELLSQWAKTNVGLVYKW